MRRRSFLIGAAALLVTVGAAEARMHHPYRGHRIVPVATGALDTFSTPSGAYSFRKLRSAYAGSAVKLQRVDTTTQDIGFVGGDFDTAAATAFCTTACTVQTWYDQSGNGRNLTQATAANQPPLIFNCVGALPCFEMLSGGHSLSTVDTITPATGTVSFSAVANRVTGTGACTWLRENGAANRFVSQAGATNWTIIGGSSGSVVRAAADGAWHAGQGVMAGAASVLNIDGAETAGTATGSTAAAVASLFGIAATTCREAESVFWDNYALTAGERAALADNQKNYWMPLPLDSFRTPSGAYSFRKLKSNYVGNAVRLRRTTGGEQDIGFTASGDFDTASATAFCAATTCFVVIWYDQSGAVRDLVQTTPANQPALVFNCRGSLPCVRGSAATQVLASAGTVTPATGLVSLNGVAVRDGSFTSTCPISAIGAATGPRLHFRNLANNLGIAGGGGTLYGTAADTAWHAVTGIINGASSTLSIDGAAPVTGSVTVSVAANALATLGCTGPAAVAEHVIWDNYALTTAERLALETNQRDYWLPAPLDTFVQPSGAYSFRKLKSTYSGPAIRIRRASDNLETDINFLGYVPGLGSPWDEAAAAAHCAATTCTVVTWYDQSGNARHLTQATPANQPALVFGCQNFLACLRTTATTQALVSAASMTPSATLTLNVVAHRTGTGVACGVIRAAANLNRIVIGPGAGSWTTVGTGSIVNSSAPDGVWHSGIGTMNGAASVLSVDGTEVTGTNTGSVAAGAYSIAGGTGVTCSEVEAVIWDPYVLSPAERAALTANQRSFWGF